MSSEPLRAALIAAIALRTRLQGRNDLSTYRLVDGAGDRLPGLYVDRYGPAVVLNVYDDAGLPDDAVTVTAALLLELLANDGVESVYVKPFARDRSRLGGQAPEETRRVTPRAGRAQPETLVVCEYDARYEVRLYDGFSTGLFLEHREHRRALARFADQRNVARDGPLRVANLFAYTCAFAVPLARRGAEIANVDVSARYLDWGRRNLELNGGPLNRVRYHRMDALEYLDWAARRPQERFDLVILDPPTFAAGDARRKRKPWRALSDYPALVQAASRVLAPGGRIFAASNTRELAAEGALQSLIEEALQDRRVRRPPHWQLLPPWPPDVRETGRVAAVLFSLD